MRAQHQQATLMTREDERLVRQRLREILPPGRAIDSWLRAEKQVFGWESPLDLMRKGRIHEVLAEIERLRVARDAYRAA